MLIKEKIPNFQEYYLMNEGMIDDIIQKYKDPIVQKFNQIKELASGKIDSFKQNQLERLKLELKIIFVKLKRINLKLSEKLFDLFIIKPFEKLESIEGPKGGIVRFLSVFIPNLIALIGLFKYQDIRYGNLQDRPEKQKIEYVAGVPSEENKAETEKLTRELVQELNYGIFDDRKSFVDRIKVYEAGDFNKPNIIPKPLKAYGDRTQVSIGYGTRAMEGETRISTKEAHDRLIDELTKIEKDILGYLKTKNLSGKFTKDQISGMVDFAFNRGPNKFKKMMDNSKNLKELTDKMKLEIGARKTNEEKPVVSQNLIHRRNFETDLILKKIKLNQI
jgi:GH24 family phage-related lysozyme (muramidase)